MSLNDTPLTEQTPVQIDTQLAEIYGKIERPRATLLRYQEIIERWETQDESTQAFYRVSQYDVDRAVEGIPVLEQQIDDLYREAAPFEDEYDNRGGWRRFFHVTNTNGHVHTSRTCASCFHDTQFAWRVDLSGLSDEEVVAREAYQACTICLPIAPAEQKAARERRTKEQRAAKKAEREAKAAAKEARKLLRDESLAHKVNAAMEKYPSGQEIQDAWYANKLTDSAYDILCDIGRGPEMKYGTPPGWTNPNAS